MPKVSVIIQSHNRPEGLRRALLSLQMQNFRDFEVVISDDSATPEPIDAVLSGPASSGLVIRYCHTPPCGAAESMREALGRTSGEYIKILHDDDWLTPHSLDVHCKVLDRHADTNAVYGCALICFPRGDIVEYSFAEKPVKVSSADWVARYAQDGYGPVQTPVTALYRRHRRFRVVWNEYLNPVLREGARLTGAGTDINLQVDNAGSNACVVWLPYVVCILGTDMNSHTQDNPAVRRYYDLWKQEYGSFPPWRY
jgi:glycosyltransferase involved in cell wall biosynthesis